MMEPCAPKKAASGPCEPAALHPGECVYLLIGGIKVACLVYSSQGNGNILVPLETTPYFLSLLQHLPVDGLLETATGQRFYYRLSQSGALMGLSGMTGNGAVANRRQSYRLTINFPAAISTDSKRWRRVRGENISDSGFLVSGENLDGIRVGQSVVVCIQLPDVDAFVSSALVRRLEYTNDDPPVPCKVGMQFVNMPLQETIKLTQFLQNIQKSKSIK